MSDPFKLEAYLERIGLVLPPGSMLSPTLSLLTEILLLHLKAITFENLELVMQRVPIDISISAVQAKLVGQKRGGYCFETNTLLLHALRALGYAAAPLLCRVRFMKSPQTATAFTHLALRVDLPGGGAGNGVKKSYLVDAGFGGAASNSPLELVSPDSSPPSSPPGSPPQHTMDGTYRFLPFEDAKLGGGGGGADGGGGVVVLQVAKVQPAEATAAAADSASAAAAAPAAAAAAVEREWMDLYAFSPLVEASDIDMEVANWWSCTHPTKARFTGSFFVSRVTGHIDAVRSVAVVERHHIQNGTYGVRSTSYPFDPSSSQPAAEEDEKNGNKTDLAVAAMMTPPTPTSVYRTQPVKGRADLDMLLLAVFGLDPAAVKTGSNGDLLYRYLPADVRDKERGGGFLFS